MLRGVHSILCIIGFMFSKCLCASWKYVRKVSHMYEIVIRLVSLGSYVHIYSEQKFATKFYSILRWY